MKNQIETLSMCKECYRHVPAVRFEKDGAIWLGKTCPEHGYSEHLIDPDSEFYYSHQYERRKPNTYWVDITNRCNLDCPHCYQIPEKLSKDPSITNILNQIKKWPDDGLGVSLVGAEPTTRKDLPEILKTIQELPGKPRPMMIVTNGINLGKKEYIKKFVGIPNLKFTIGLNHPDYNGGVIRKQQEKGIKNCVNLGLVIKNFTYTLGDLNQLDFILEEIQRWHELKICDNARIQLGVDIGRVPEHQETELYLSDLVKKAKQICELKNWSWELDTISGNRTHFFVRINGLVHRLIKWVDVNTIYFSEVYSESYADMIPGKPMSPLLHQVILRDQFKNKKKFLFDVLPEKYR